MFEYQAKVVNVVDGDTVDVEVDLGFKICTKQRLRLAHIDTPERSEENYSTAKRFVHDITLGKTVLIKTTKPSKWGYYLAEVYIEDRNLAEMLIAAKLAKRYDGGAK